MKTLLAFVFAALLLTSFVSAYPRVVVLEDNPAVRSITYDPEAAQRRSELRSYNEGYDDGYYDGYVTGYKDRRTTRTVYTSRDRCSRYYDDDDCVVPRVNRPRYVTNTYYDSYYPYMFEVPSTGYYYYERWY